MAVEWMEWMEWVEWGGITFTRPISQRASASKTCLSNPTPPHSIHSVHSTHSTHSIKYCSASDFSRAVETATQQYGGRGLESRKGQQARGRTAQRR